MGFGFMMTRPGTGDTHEDMEMRRRRRAAYDAGYDDALHDIDMRRGRRRSRSEHEDRPPYGGYPHFGDGGDDMEMRRRRRAAYDNVWGDHMPFDFRHDDGERYNWGEDNPGMGFATAHKVPFDPSMEDVLEHAEHLIKNPPETWPPYLQKHDFAGIVRMEAKELMKALESGKSPKEIKKELTHTIAALFQLVKE